jgi:excisionase family DNA binding protein
MQRLKPDAPAPAAYSIKVVAERLGLSYRTIWRGVREGRVKSIRCGGAVRIPAGELEKVCTKGF